jgi:subtilisin family serine protease
MKFLCTLFLIVFSAGVFSQNEGMNNALKMRLYNEPSKNQQHSVLVKGDISKLKAAQTLGRFQLNYFSGNIASITINISDLSNLLEHKIISSAEFLEARKQPLNDTMVYRNRIKAVKLWTAPLAQAYNGSGIIMGIIDTGIDFNHGDFKDSLGLSRIRYLWDQVQTSGSIVPAPFNYGIEWTDTQINNNQCTHADLLHYGHGTHVSGIAAGNGLANGTHEGVASKVDIIAVALDFNKTGPTIADAVQYIFNKATLLGKPCVINASIGNYYGSHDATDLEAKLIENMVKNIPGRVLVAAAGNAGNINHHVKTQVLGSDTNFTWINNGTNSLEYWCYADTNQIKNVQISVGANRQSYFDLGRIGFKNYNYGLSAVKSDTLKHNNQRIGIVKTSASINADGVYELYLQINADSTNLLWRIETKGIGLHHAWNFDFVSTGLPTQAQYAPISNYLKPDSLYTIVSSFQCSDEVIAVANYVNMARYYDVNDSLRNTGETAGEIASSSSIGPTRTGKQKPDISASGAGIMSSMALGLAAQLITNAPQVVAQGSLHVLGGGTSAASPVVAGLAALYLEKHPSATNQQVKSAILNCAYHDTFTGTNLPNYRWGYGKLDGKATMLCGETIYNAIAEMQPRAAIQSFPNPFSKQTLIRFNESMSGTLYLYNAEGKMLMTETFYGNSYELNMEKISPAYEGLLLVRIQTASTTFTLKLIKEI